MARDRSCGPELDAGIWNSSALDRLDKHRKTGKAIVIQKAGDFGFAPRITAHRTADLLKTGGRTPILLLDDIFDRLDANRVEEIVKLVSGDEFGQIFISDTNRHSFDKILTSFNNNYHVYTVENGEIALMTAQPETRNP